MAEASAIPFLSRLEGTGLQHVRIYHPLPFRAETVALGKRMAGCAAPGALIAFTGGLGAGKTAFYRGSGRGSGLHRPGPAPPLPSSTITAARARWPTLTSTASPPRTICAPPVSTIIWIRGPLWRQSGAKTSPICWPWKTRSTSTLTGWMTPPAGSPSRGSAYEFLAVDTAGKNAGVALLQDDRLLYECYLDGGHDPQRDPDAAWWITA